MYEKVCENCGKPFITDRSNKRFCCRNCKNKNKKKRIRKGIRYDNIEYITECKVCGKTFVTNYSDKVYCDDCKQEVKKLQNKKFRDNNRGYITKYFKNRYNTDLNFKLRLCMGGFIYRCIKSENKTQSSLKYIDYSPEDLKQHLEKQFIDDMSWENYGVLWQVDHIRPLASYTFVNEDGSINYDNIREANSLENLRPLLVEENLSKGAWYNGKLYRNGVVVREE